MPHILFVAMPESVHAARWISQISDQGWDVHLFSSHRANPHPNFQNLTLYGSELLRPSMLDKTVRYKGWTSYHIYRDFIENKVRHRQTVYKEIALAKVIRRVKPDLIHALEFQHSAYLTLGARKLLSAPFPKWIATNWGSDIYLFGRLAKHQPKIREVLTNCDYYSAECQRDVELAWQMGYTGKVLPILPNGGGYDLEKASALRQPGLTSARKVIALKGYQTWAGRALVGLQALRLCAADLQGYEVIIYSAGEEVEIAAELFAQETGIPATVMPKASHEEILKLHGRARISIGLSISDAISTSLLEALVMGSFPIQSCTACADEWIADGKSGLIVPPEDPHQIAEAIRRALVNDALVNSAAELNARVSRQRLEQGMIKAQVVNMYQEILSNS